MMNRIALLTMVCLIVALFASPAHAGDKTVTLEGKVVCAKCTLHEAGRDECQNVLIVENKKGEVERYYMTKNEVAEEYGDVCMAKNAVRITGTVKKQDGQHWIVASKITPVEEQG